MVDQNMKGLKEACLCKDKNMCNQGNPITPVPKPKNTTDASNGSEETTDTTESSAALSSGQLELATVIAVDIIFV